MLSIDEARQRILRKIRPLAARRFPVEESAHRVLGRPVRARADLPLFDNSAMDGYACRARDVRRAGPHRPAVLRCIGVSAAGKPFRGRLGTGETVRIFTGAVVPRGADAVVIQEVCRERRLRREVEIREPVRPGENIRQKGEEIRKGQLLFRPGERPGIGGIGLAIAAGHRTLSCHPTPVCGVLSTGDELRPPGSRRAAGQIHDANRPMILERIRGLGGEAVDLGTAADRLPEIRRRVRAALARCDLLVTIGGASVGEKDFVRQAFRAAGMRLEFWRVSMRPGKPFAFARRGRRCAFALPGNPSSALVSFSLFVEPAIRRLQGSRARNRWLRAPLYPAQNRNRVRDRLLWCRLVDRGPAGKSRLWARALPAQGSHMFTGLARGEALARIPAGPGRIREGEAVNVLVLSRPRP